LFIVTAKPKSQITARISSCLLVCPLSIKIYWYNVKKKEKEGEEEKKRRKINKIHFLISNLDVKFQFDEFFQFLRQFLNLMQQFYLLLFLFYFDLLIKSKRQKRKRKKERKKEKKKKNYFHLDHVKEKINLFHKVLLKYILVLHSIQLIEQHLHEMIMTF